MPRLLLIEDNPGDARLLEELLKNNEDLSDKFFITHVERVAAALVKLNADEKFDYIVSDMTLPDSRGIDTVIAIGEAAPEAPIIFMTGTNDEALSIAAINAGAQDYLVKGKYDSELLIRSLKYAAERKKFQNDMRRVLQNEEISKQKIKLLDDQRKQLLSLNKTKDDFISIASHQLRTPASAVKQYIGMLVQGFKGDFTPEQLEILQKAYVSNERQLNVINELLKTAQLDSPKTKYNFEKFDISELICECLDDLAPSIELKHLHIQNSIPDGLSVKGDRQEIKLVVTNLIENAVKYTHEYKQIDISSSDSGKYLEICFKDQGVGISLANQKVIFDKFTRVDNELSDTVKGTGLGLYWAKRIMKIHKGSLTVHSELGHGSSFVMRIPR